jgi:hypothetical protein
VQRAARPHQHKRQRALVRSIRSRASPGWVFLWFGYTAGHRDEGLQLCLETLAGAR